jgi:subtilase family protein/WD40 repeat protein
MSIGEYIDPAMRMLRAIPIVSVASLLALGAGLPGAVAETLGERLAGRPTVDGDRALAQFLGERFRTGHAATHVVVVRRSAPDPRLWDTWKAAGVSFAVNLRPDAWIVRVATSPDERANADKVAFLRGPAGVVSAFPYVAPYKAREDLLLGRFRFANRRAATDPNVVVEFFPDTSPSVMAKTVAEFHQGPAASERMDERTRVLRVDPARIRALAEIDQVYVVEEPIPRLPLMNEMRSITGVDDVQLAGGLVPPSYALSGLGIRMSTTEGLALAHPDFKQDPLDVAPRWASGCGVSDDIHGAMTAGLMLGDGSGSVGGGATSPYLWRGVAPNATFVCYGTTPGSERPDVASFSFVQAFGDYNYGARATDRTVRGGNGPVLRIPHVRAAGNNGASPPQYGTETGYYSMLGTAKNQIGVGNGDSVDLRWQGTSSSLGPTFDDRIKPDVVAPGTIVGYVGGPSGLDVDLEYVRVVQSGTVTVDWSFSQPGAFHGWGQNLNNDAWWTIANVWPVTIESALCLPGPLQCLRAHMTAPPWGQGYRHTPYVATFASPNLVPTEDLNIVPTASDVVEIKYRIAPSQERAIRFNLFFGSQDIVNPGSTNNYYTMSNTFFPVVADGNWNVVSIPVGGDPNWTARTACTSSGSPCINHLGLAYEGPTGLHVPTPGTGMGYINAGGTSASAPVVAGILALMLERTTKAPLNVVVADHTNWSPYFRAQPATGAPLPSTLKAILIHTAQDLAYMPHVSDMPNPDTGSLQTYHRGPDYVTGYGLVNARAAIDIIALDEGAASGDKNIFEDQFTTADILPSTAQPPCSNGCLWGYREYTRIIPSGRTLPLRATLAYDDFEGAANPDPAVQTSPRLVNNIDLELLSPTGVVFRPWTLDPLYVPSALPNDYAGNIEPEPIPASAVRPARRDQVNDRDNVKQVVVDYPEAGAWKIVVGMRSYGAPPPQTFSLVIDGAVVPPAPNLSGGKLVYSSGLPGLFGPKLQLFVQPVGSSETQITSEPTNARDPAWSYDGNRIVHISDEGWVFGWTVGVFGISFPTISWRPESIDVRTPTGTLLARFATFATTGRQHAKYPEWSPDGRRIIVTTFDTWGTRELRSITFSAPYNLSSPTTQILVPTNFAGNSDDPAGGQFSPDGTYVYFQGDSNVDTGRLYRVTVSTGAIDEIFGDGAPMHRAFQPSVSSDGSVLIFNSELYKDGVPNQIDEELLSVSLKTGTITQLTHTAGHQAGRFAKNDPGQAILLKSNTSPTAPSDLYLYENGTLSSPMTSAHKADGGYDWVK